MRAEELRKRIAKLGAQLAPIQQQLVSVEEERHRLAMAHRRQYSLGPTLTVVGEAVSDTNQIRLEPGDVITRAQTIMLLEIHDHLASWQRGEIDELVLSGAWPNVGPGYERVRP